MDRDKLLVGEEKNDFILDLHDLEALWETAPPPPQDFELADKVSAPRSALQPKALRL